MRMLEVTEDGELKESPFRKENVESKKVYIFVNDDDKQIILWSGKDARTRIKFIGARLASSLRLEQGLSYKMTQVDESVDADFIRHIDAKPGEKPLVAAVAPTPKYEPSHAPQVSRSTVQPQQRVAAPEVPFSPQPRAQQFQIPTQRAEPDQSKVVERLTSIETPKGFERELIVIGHDMFAVSVSKTRVFGKEKVEHKVGKVTNPIEDGIFLAEEYTPRVIIENGRVLAVEFLKAAPQGQKKSERGKPSAKEVSPEEPLESLMEKHLSEITNIFKSGPKKEEEDDESD
jgi:hypothetical protein